MQYSFEMEQGEIFSKDQGANLLNTKRKITMS